MCPTTIQVEERTKRGLFRIAADLQRTLGRKVTLNEAIVELMKSFRENARNKELVLSLFGSVKGNVETRRDLWELRRNEVNHLERITRKYGT